MAHLGTGRQPRQAISASCTGWDGVIVILGPVRRYRNHRFRGTTSGTGGFPALGARLRRVLRDRLVGRGLLLRLRRVDLVSANNVD